MDRFDVMVLIGLVLIGVAVWLAFGLAWTLAYAGIALVVVGAIGAFFSYAMKGPG